MALTNSLVVLFIAVLLLIFWQNFYSNASCFSLLWLYLGITLAIVRWALIGPLVLLWFCFFIQFNVPFKIISLIETSQSVGGAKREYPGKTTWHTRKQNLACLTCGQCGARTYTRHSGEMMEWLRALKYSDLTHSATGAAWRRCLKMWTDGQTPDH